MECPRCYAKIQADRVLPLTMICSCGWHDDHMAKNSDMVFRQRIKRVFVVMTALLTLSLTYRFALDRVQARAALHARAEMQAAKAASEARTRVAMREAARRHPASEATTRYVSNRASVAPSVARRTPSQNDPRSLHSRSSKS